MAEGACRKIRVVLWSKWQVREACWSLKQELLAEVRHPRAWKRQPGGTQGDAWWW